MGNVSPGGTVTGMVHVVGDDDVPVNLDQMLAVRMLVDGVEYDNSGGIGVSNPAVGEYVVTCEIPASLADGSSVLLVADGVLLTVPNSTFLGEWQVKRTSAPALPMYVSGPLSVQSLSATDLKTGDTGPDRRVQVVDANGDSLALPASGVNVTYRLKDRLTGGVRVEAPGSVVNPELGVVAFSWVSAGVTIPVAGSYREEWTIAISGGQTLTVPQRGYVGVNVSARL